MKASVFFIGSIVLGVLTVGFSVGAFREPAPKDQASRSRFGVVIAGAIGALLVVQGVLGLLRH